MPNKQISLDSNKLFLHWLPILIGLIAMYAPTFHHLANSLWQSDDQGHGPLVLMVVVFLFWQQRNVFITELAQSTNPILGYSLFIVGLLLYILGRSQDILIFDIGSLIPILMGLILVTKGTKALKQVWFPLFFILFMIPLPGFIVDSITLPMKMGVSYVAEHILYSFGYPIARTGVILQIGQYQLLVADACAGMHTLISLEALGLLYLNLIKHDSLFRNITLAILIIPISFAANVIRVMVLTLVTYHFGDEAGQGFVHDFAGLVLFMVALLLIITVDSVLQFGQKRWYARGVE